MAERLAKVRVKDLVLTNPCLDPNHVNSIVEEITAGGETEHHQGWIFVHEINGRLLVNDGNHFIRACQIVGVEWVLANIYDD